MENCIHGIDPQGYCRQCNKKEDTKKNMKNKTIKLYYHKTSGGAEYLFDTFIAWKHNGKSGKEGAITPKTKYIVRLDSDIKGEAELTIK